MSGGSDDNGDKGPRSSADMVSTMPVAIAALRERLERLDSQLSGVDSNLDRMAGADPNATEEIQMNPGQRARIDAAAGGMDDTDTRIPVVSSHAAALAEVDAVLGQLEPPPELPDLAPPAAESAGFGRRDTMPEMPVSPPATTQSGESAQIAAPSPPSATPSTSDGGGERSALGIFAVLIVLGGAGYFIWQSTQLAPSAPPNPQTAAVAPTASKTATPSPAAPPSELNSEPRTQAATAVASSSAAAPSIPAAAPSIPAAAPSIPAAAPSIPAAAPPVEEPVNLEPMVVPPQDDAPAAASEDPKLPPHEATAEAALQPPAAATVNPAEVTAKGGAPSAASGASAAVERGAVKAALGAAPVPKPAAALAPAKRPVSAVPEGELIDAMEAIRADPAPAEIVRGTHYFVSNESKHHLWRDQVSDLGGIMVGVGAEQNYLIAGWSRPELLILMDFDIYIPWLHKAYRVAFELASTPDELITLWRDKEGRERLKAGIVRTYGETGEVQDILRAVKFAKAVGRHLAKLQASYAGLGIPCFLTDQGQFDFIANLWRSGRVLAIRGDLTGKRTMVDLAAFSRISDLPVRILYMSNAEFYFRYSAGRFRDNIVGLPFDSRSLVLRTDPHSGTKYRFYEQRGEDFIAWLERGRASSVAAMGKYRTRRADIDDFVLDKLPEQVGKAR